jgi:hypothetical protein
MFACPFCRAGITPPFLAEKAPEPRCRCWLWVGLAAPALVLLGAGVWLRRIGSPAKPG